MFSMFLCIHLYLFDQMLMFYKIKFLKGKLDVKV